MRINRLARKYCRRVGKAIVCAGKAKRLILERLSASVRGYLAAHPEADYARIEQVFGTPEQVAVTYAVELTAAEAAGLARRKRTLVWAVALTAAAAVFLWGGCAAQLLANHCTAVISEAEEAPETEPAAEENVPKPAAAPNTMRSMSGCCDDRAAGSEISIVDG